MPNPVKSRKANNSVGVLSFLQLESRDMPGTFLGELFGLNPHSSDIPIGTLSPSLATPPFAWQPEEISVFRAQANPASAWYESEPLLMRSKADSASTSNQISDQSPLLNQLGFQDSTAILSPTQLPLWANQVNASQSESSNLMLANFATSIQPTQVSSPVANASPVVPPTSPPPPPTSPPPASPPPPVGPLAATDDSLNVKHDRTTAITASDLLANDTVPTGTSWKVQIVGKTSHGSITDYQVNSDMLTFQYNPDTAYTGPDSFTYRITDGTQFSNVATVSIQVTNTAPVATDSSYSIYEDAELDVSGGGSGLNSPPGSPPAVGSQGILATATDAENDPLRSLLVTNVANGMLDLKDDGTFTYLPNPNFSGMDSFTYKISDGVTYSSTKTVSITVQPNNNLDIDGHDLTTTTDWMRESEEQSKGLGVSTATSATILARAPKPPTSEPGWSMVSRGISWPSSTLTVGGNTSGSLIDLSGSSADIVLSVVGKQDGSVNNSGFPGSLGTIEYSASWINNVTHEAVASIADLPVGPKADLQAIEFTSDQHVLLNNTVNALDVKDSPVYNPIQFSTGLERAIPKKNAPISQKMDTNVTAKVTLSYSGLKATDKVQLVGKSNTPGFNFESIVYDANPQGQTTIPVTSSDKLGKSVKDLSVDIDWSLVVNPGVNKATLNIGSSTKHEVFTIFDVPKNPDGKDAFKPLTIRMRSAVSSVGTAYTNALNGGARPNPTVQRVAYETLQLHVFNLHVNIAANLGDKTKGWRVPDFWGQAYDNGKGNTDPGSDCVSGAIYVNLAISLTGLVGDSSVRLYTAPTPTAAQNQDFTTPVDFTGELFAKSNANLADNDLKIGLQDRQGGLNNFEACVIVKSGNTTFILPSGAGPFAYTDPKDVLTIFKLYGAFKKSDVSLFYTYATYGDAKAKTVPLD